MTKEEFETVFYRTRDKLYRYALRFVQAPEAAEDVVQDVMVKLWQKRDEMAQVENIDAWLMVLTRNRSLDMLRTQKAPHVPVDEAASLKDRAPIADRQLEQADLLAQVRRCMDDLPEKPRTVLHLREIEQMTYEEIVQATGYTLEDVKVTLFRARKHIQRLLAQLNVTPYYPA